ncbi:MAG: UMP kinase [Thermoplasmata archaeon]|nr:UMP kinase [Thermoplasmata archaeon]
MEKVVVSIGGSILVPGENDAEFIGKLAKMLKEVSKEVQLAIVCGGGKTARYYAGIAKDLGGSTYEQDILGIAATRMNAQLLMLALGEMPDAVITDPEELVKASQPGKIVVMGGTVPGHTTDAVSSMVAAAMKADRIINGTSVDAVYTADPRKDPNAKKIPKMTIDELAEIVYKEHGASKSSVFDPLGVKLAKENRMDILMIDGRNLDELKNAILGKPINGTFVNSH